MTDRLTEIRARLDAAGDTTKWLVGDDPVYSRKVAIVEPAPDAAPGDSYDDYIATFIDPENADLIAHAPADIAWLLAEVERLEKRVAMYEVVKS